MLSLQIFEILDQEVPQKEQPSRLVESCGQQQGELWTPLLPDQQWGWGGGRSWWIDL